MFQYYQQSLPDDVLLLIHFLYETFPGLFTQDGYVHVWMWTECGLLSTETSTGDVKACIDLVIHHWNRWLWGPRMYLSSIGIKESTLIPEIHDLSPCSSEELDGKRRVRTWLALSPDSWNQVDDVLHPMPLACTLHPSKSIERSRDIIAFYCQLLSALFLNGAYSRSSTIVTPKVNWEVPFLILLSFWLIWLCQKWAYMIIICRCRRCRCRRCWRLCLWTVHLVLKMAAYGTMVSIWRQLLYTYLTVVTSCEYFCYCNLF